MKWFYAESGEQRGPYTVEELRAALNDGRLNRDTLVWRDGLEKWLPCYEAIAGIGADGGEPEGYAVSTAGANALFGGAASPSRTSLGVECLQCRRLRDEEQVTFFGEAPVCAVCKPLYVQKLREGIRVEQGPELAGIGARFGATMIDGIILQVFNMIGMAMMWGTAFALTSAKGIKAPNEGGAVFAALGVGLNLAAILVSFAYYIFFWGKWGATPGKMALKIAIIGPDGKSPGYKRAAIRVFGQFVSGITLGIGFLMALWSPERQALHDRIANTRVIRKPGKP